MKKLRVLLVDDEIMIREGFKRLFDWGAHDCEVVGEAADELLSLGRITYDYDFVQLRGILLDRDVDFRAFPDSCLFVFVAKAREHEDIASGIYRNGVLTVGIR